jgi:hypothetical protein
VPVSRRRSHDGYIEEVSRDVVPVREPLADDHGRNGNPHVQAEPEEKLLDPSDGLRKDERSAVIKCAVLEDCRLYATMRGRRLRIRGVGSVCQSTPQ